MKGFFSPSAVKILIGLLVGISLLLLVSRFANIPATFQALQQNLMTPRGVGLACLSGVAFLLAFSIRGIRWKLFLNPIGSVSAFTAIRLVFVSIFLNFLLPISGGELAKALILKRIAAIPISRTLPTIALDRSLDLLPALFIIALVPLFGIHMDIKLWFILGAVGGLLVCLIGFMALAVWKRDAAIAVLQKITRVLPRTLGGKVECFASSFVDALRIGTSRPQIFIPAVLLTCAALFFDSLFALLAFRVIGFPISLGEALFGYTLYNMFYIVPTLPGQVGSNEAVGLLVFAGLLHVPASQVLAMFIFSHPWAALLMCAAGMIALKTLGLTISTALKTRAEEVGEQTKPPAKTKKRDRNEQHNQQEQKNTVVIRNK